MDKTSVNELNAFLKGEHMAIDSYERYIEKIKDTNIKEELQNIQKDHKLHATIIGERILNLGGHPVNGVGLTGKVAEVASVVKDIGLKGTTAILKEVKNGEDNGIKMAQEIVKGDLDNDSMTMINSILDDDRQHLSMLDNIINTHIQ
jgi:bacterioferritin